MPPPNVTGVLHMGHALNCTLPDTLVRWRRMQGHDVLWQPGTDHAGISTEAVVAKQLIDKGASREALGREAFIAEVWKWKEQSGSTIVRQLRKLGASCDWSRERFTMDEGLSRAVRCQVAKRFDAGLIYRGMRMVNWSPALRTALSDDEVIMEEVDGAMWKLRYPLAEGGGEIQVETTRPETYFGDLAVAVHPDDERYKGLIGKLVTLPLINRRIPIIADAYADPAKGTGAVKITPSHDPNDYEVGARHRLGLLQCIGLDGAMTEAAGSYKGLDRFDCRKRLLKDLAAGGFLLGETRIRHAVGHSERAKEPIEPMVTEQWFVKMRPLADRALAETRAGRGGVPSRALDRGVLPLAGERARLVHLTPDLVGASHPGLALRRVRQDHRGGGDALQPAPIAGAARSTQDPDVLDTLVLLEPVAVLDPGLAGRPPRAHALLPDIDPGHRPRHHLHVGGAHGDGGPVPAR